MKKLLLLVNPYAGRMESKNVTFDLIDRADAEGYNVETHPTRGFENVINIIKSRGKEFDLIICCGGDGTFNATVSGLAQIENPPLLGYIPCGSTNDFARTLNLSTDPILEMNNILKGKEFTFDVGKFNDRFFTYIAAFGAFTEVSYQTPQNLKNAFGHAAYILSSIKALPDLKPQRVRVSCEEGIFEDDYLYGAISNSTSVAGMIKLDKERVNLNDGKFELMLIKNPHDIIELGIIIDDLINQKYNSPYVKFISTSQLSIETPDGMPWTLDGEDGGRHTRVEINNLHNLVKLIM